MGTLQIRLPNGYLVATISQDPDYPGVDIEYVDDNERETDLSRPRVLVEAPIEDNGAIRALIWNDSKNEDYTKDIELYNPKYKRGE